MAQKITAKQVWEARDALNESQTEFAKRFEVDQSTIHRWETDGPPKSGPAVIALRQLIEKIEERVA
jgi:DNA-binding transcriptional regulator YiaG